MADFLQRKPGEAIGSSRYIQMNLFPEEGAGSPTIVRSTKSDTPDSTIKYNSAGGSHNETQTTTEKGQYLKVRVIGETHAGHLILFDETPGYERLYMLHPNGSYVDIIPDGKHDKTEGNLFTFVSKNWNVEVKTDRITFIHHDEKITIDNNRNITIGVDETADIGRNKITNIGHNRTDEINKDWTLHCGGNILIEADGNITFNAQNIYLNET